ncbi:MAG: hypothetical protein K5893_03230 [Prevotella sp.]|nr:hypothetical protein [Prevotella sp.]
MNEEDILKEQFGNKRPFTVPEGFFDSFAEKMMQQLPEEENVEQLVVERRPGVIKRLRPYAIAASLALLLVSAATLLWQGNQAQQPSEQFASTPSTTQQSQEYTIDQIADYAMLDNQDFYGYLAEY